MAEQEVIKHTKKIYSIWSGKEHGFWHKLKEFLIEVLIIVIAVTLSIWLHNRSEHANQQQEVKQFLLGLKSDLTSDLAEMKDDRQSYEDQRKAFSYITGAKLHQTLSLDSLSKYENWIFNTTGLNPNNGRFEGFKSSGKISTIENKELQNDIMDLYQEDIVALLASTDVYTGLKKEFFDILRKKQKRLTDSTDNFSAVLLEDEVRNICITLSSPIQLMERYDACIKKAKKIIAEIDHEYGKE